MIHRRGVVAILVLLLLVLLGAVMQIVGVAAMPRAAVSTPAAHAQPSPLPTRTAGAARAVRGGTVSVDLVRQGPRWLLSFVDGDDPMPALAGAT